MTPVDATDRLRLAEPQRQSPIAVVFLALRVLRGIGIFNIAIAALFLVRAPIPGGVFVLIPLLALIIGGFGVLSWWRFTFRVAGDELQVTKGVLSIERLTVPLDRVQSVSMDQEFLHRAVGVVRASIDTAGSGVAELTIDAVDRETALALQRVTAEHVRVGPAPAGQDVGADVPPPPPIPDVVLIRHTPGRLVRIALAQSPWAGLALFAPLFAIGDDISSVLGVDVPEPISDEPDLGLWVVWLGIMLLVAATLLSMILQVVREVTTNWDLTLTKTPTGLRRTAGLFSRSAKASSLPKIQRIESTQTPIQRWLGFRHLRLPTIGAGDLFIPGATDDQIGEVRRLVLDADARVDELRNRVSPLAVFLAARNTTLIALLIVAATWAFLGAWSLLFLSIAVAETLASRRRTRLYRWGISESGLADRAIFFSTKEREMALRKAQVVTVSRSIFERGRGLATVKVSTAEGSIEIGMIPLAEARAVRDRALFVAETDAREWM